ncbi:glycosyltransferase family 9 protein [Erwinia sp. S63]|uniref:glycosyltransferase family 9 protein n=1 Tax=Erwinia sp. S63 TaxID=2769341 RepID=UPI00190B01B3|nr:glycosyltransferase family 9 protein [Erwinia sp. S63]MBK0098791.1 glycosyltransferase family 9 protein [Erwinia sp. S63]
MENKKKFAKLRALNRQRNYLMKALRLNIARWIWDHRSKRDFSISESRSVLFLRDDDKIGDMVVSTSLFREFRREGFLVDVLAGKNNSKIIECNPYVNDFFVVEKDNKRKLAQAKILANKKYDVVVDMGDKISPFHLLFLKKLNAKNVVGFNKNGFNIYNKSLDYLGYDAHITERYNLLMKSFGFRRFNTDYDIHVNDEVCNDVSDFMNKIEYSYKIVLNPFAADVRRDMSPEQINLLISKIKIRWSDVEVILVGDPLRINKLDCINAIVNPFTSLASACEIIRLADMIISPDTAIVHIAATWKKPLIGLYGNDIHGEYINSIVWGPGYDLARQIYTQDKYHTVSTIDVDDIILSMNELMLLH